MTGITIWNIKGGNVVRQIGDCIGYFKTVEFSPNGQLLAAGSLRNGAILLWDTKTGEQVQQLEGHTIDIRAIAFSSDNKLIASASFENTVRLWKVEMGERKEQSEAVREQVNILKLSPDRQIVASASLMNGIVKLWKITREFSHQLGVKNFFLSDIAFCSNGQTLALKLLKGVHVLECSNRDPGRLGKEPTCDFALSPDGQLLALVVKRNEGIRIWTERGELEQELEGFKSDISAAALSADGEQLAISSTTQAVIWNLVRETALRLRGDNWLIDELIFSPDGLVLASASRSNSEVKIWGAKSGQLLQTIAMDFKVSLLRFSGDNRYLGTNQGILRLNLQSEMVESDVPKSTVGIFFSEDWITYNDRNSYGFLRTIGVRVRS